MKIQNIFTKQKKCLDKMSAIVKKINSKLLLSYHNHYDEPRFSIFEQSNTKKDIQFEEKCNGIVFEISVKYIKYYPEIIMKFKKAKLI